MIIQDEWFSKVNEDTLPMISWTWKEFLRYQGGAAPELAYLAMQEKYPGDYTLQHRYDSDKGGYYYTMHWEDEVSKTFWLLKYS